MKYFIATITFSLFSVTSLLSQTYTTWTKNCGSCGNKVSNSSGIGQKCPLCGVTWGRENETKKETSTYYIHSEEETESNLAIVNTQESNLRIRNFYSESATIIGSVPRGKIVTLLGQESRVIQLSNGQIGAWKKIQYNGLVGWVWGNYLKTY
jgi:predicted RNA-binding Zn-ribbon protein involved in translation (DUF1610 family)